MPISPDDKRRVEKKARESAMSMAEYARRAMLDYDPGADRANEEAELRALIEAHEAAFARMTQQLDHTDAAIERMLAYFAGKGEAP